MTGNKLICVESDIGLKRENNEDAYLIINHGSNDVDVRLNGFMYTVADGLGGHAGGEIASRMACKGMVDYYLTDKLDVNVNSDIYETALDRLKTVIYKIHEQIRNYGKENNQYKGLGTTLSVLVLLKDMALIAHVGDSRIYRLRNHSLELMTQDHTMARIFIELGHLSENEALKHPTRHVLTQAVGHQIEVINSRIEKVKKKDIFLLCSDGLYDKVTEREICDILMNNSISENICGHLIKKALQKGGNDNITAIVVQI